MTKVILSIACTLDGYIARENGSVDFLDPFNGNEEIGEFFTTFFEEISTIIMGNTTFQEYHTLPGFFDQYKGKDIYVYSRNQNLTHEKVTFVNENPQDFLENLTTEKNIWLLGGAEINKSFLVLNLIDEYIITIFPVIIGKGIPLFAKSNFETQLKFVKCEEFNSGVVNLFYSK